MQIWHTHTHTHTHSHVQPLLHMNGSVKTVEVWEIQSLEGHRPSNGLDWPPCLSVPSCKMGAESFKAAQALVKGVT